MNVALQGILTGLLLSVLIGPVFFLLIELSLTRGFRSAAAFDAGVLISDILWIATLQLGIFKIASADIDESNLALLGALCFVGFGISMMNSTEQNKPHRRPTNRSLPALCMKGFMLNSLNPSVVLFWLGTSSWLLLNGSNHSGYAILYYVCVMSTVVILDLLKIILATRIKPLITTRGRDRIAWMAGLVLIVFGVGILINYAYN